MSSENRLDHLGCSALIALGILTLISIPATAMFLVNLYKNNTDGVISNGIVVGSFLIAYWVATIKTKDFPKKSKK